MISDGRSKVRQAIEQAADAPAPHRSAEAAADRTEGDCRKDVKERDIYADAEKSRSEFCVVVLHELKITHVGHQLVQDRCGGAHQSWGRQ